MSTPGPEDTHVILQADAAKRARRYRQAAQILEDARQGADTSFFRRQLAYTIGAGVEYRLQVQHSLQIVIDRDIVGRLLVELDYAISLDNTIPDLHWDTAVIHALFTGDLDTAQAALDRALELGMQHPMMGSLLAILARKGEPEKPGNGPAYRLRNLIFRLVNATADDTIPEFGDPTKDADPPQSFADYVMRVEKEVRSADPDPGPGIGALVETWRAMREGSLVTTASADYGTELLYRAAAASTDDDLKRATLSDVAMLWRDMSFQTSSGDPTPSDLRKARRIAQRALDIVAGAEVDIDADLHGDLWLALGQGSARPADLQLGPALDAYTHALQLKRIAGNDADVVRLTDLLKKMLDHAIQHGVGVSFGFGALGQARSDLEAAYAASRVIGDPKTMFRTGMHYVHLLSTLEQAILAINVLDELLDAHDWSQDERFEILFEKAMRLSEARSQSDALALHQQLKDDVAARSDRERCIFWNSYSNVLRDLQFYEDALDANREALASRPAVGAGQFDQLGCMLHSNRGIILLALDRVDEAESEAELAVDVAAQLPNNDEQIHAGELVIQVALRKGNYAKAIREYEKVTGLQSDRITKGKPDPTVWQSVLHGWSRIEGMGLEAKIKSGEPPGKCLALAESLKGRLLWLLGQLSTADARGRLTSEAFAPAVQRCQEWVSAGGGKRCLVTMFGSSRGIAIFSISGLDGSVAVQWIDGPVYDEFRDRILNVWGHVTDCALDQSVQISLARAGARPELLLESTCALSHLLLEHTGALLARAVPSLSDGGTALVIIPHRALRALPLAHARLPDGRHLSEVFDEVSIAATMDLFASTLDVPVDIGETRELFLDPEDNLPFARLEGAIAAAAEVRTGWRATKREFLRALKGSGAVFVSAHSEFVPTNPWESWIAFHDGRLSLADIVQERSIRRSLLVLSSCESGSSQQSNSDEPFGFPTLLHQAGAGGVIAPLWRVDDFATFLLITRLQEGLVDGLTPAQALGQASHWLRGLTARDALRRLDDLETRMGEALADRSVCDAAAALGRQRGWLQAAFVGPERPFEAPLFWAAFQHLGKPYVPLERSFGDEGRHHRDL